MEEDAVDTGPGLEAQESWDYSHSPLLTDALAAMEAHAGRKSRPGSGPPALQRLDQEYKPVANGVANGRIGHDDCLRPESEQQASTSRPHPATGKGSGGEGFHSAFVPASREGWAQALYNAKDPVAAALLSDVPSLAGSLPRAETAEEMDLRLRAERRAHRTERAAQITSLAALSLLLIAATLFLFLAYTGWNALAAAAALFCAAIAGYPALQLLWFALSSQMFRCWRKLTPEERFGWGQKGSSLVHSSIMAAVGVSVVLRRDWRSLDLINGRDERVAAFIALELGYLLQDTGMEVYKQVAFRRSFSLLHWFHHLVILFGLPWYYRRMKGDYFFGAFFLWNTSTVPLQLRWFQSTSGIQKGPLYQLNNLALLASFLACRICIVPFLMYAYGNQKGWSLFAVPFQIPWFCTAASCCTVAINGIWIHQLLRHAFRRKARRKARREKTAVLTADQEHAKAS